ncbi:type I polyketide synthase [Streptomyces coffeae]|uniref:SDR family NAD(P)-dependent oxidoreductase n=1 Tax=Streptomyces coffeae TaxID=621382 RepID=A0ABS1NQ33_9ACTN|nr:type I polyketide synthase [Streptomyces coffeae]MBL1102118.1 SDR family NAD(P)-dependent oxidoreductase [Streptomyces coffeae]
MKHPQDTAYATGAGLDRRLVRDPIAIVGLAALYPKALDLRAFWDNVISAADCIEDVPRSHWDVREHYDPDPTAPDKTYAKRGGFIPDVAFNPLEFGLPPNTLEVTDVLQLLSLVVARDLLKDAGADQPWYDRSRTGVVLGITGANQLTQPLTARLQTPVVKEVVRSCGLSDRDAEEVAAKFVKAYAPWEENSFPGMLGNVVAGRIANRFDLGGINMTVDAACASSLGAVRAAVSELLEGRSDTMLVGGCDAENTIFMYVCFSKTPALSKSGRIRPFDKDADGTLLGEGIGMLALRRLSDAERDGNRIYAVLRGLGTSSDGRFKSIYAPRKEGQMAALRRAYHDADCSPASVELFEAHGTGTVVGDATELSALSAVVGETTDATSYAAMGSVKSQIGHTKAAAGAAGMIKLALALHHKVLPPTINVDAPNPIIDFAHGPFYVNSESRPWIRDPRRATRRAAISSFGFGGANFHLVLDEYGDGDDLKVMFPVAQVHLWHAPDPATLEQALADGRPAHGGPVPEGHARLAFVARTEGELAALRETALKELRVRKTAESWSHPKGIHFRRSAARRLGKVAALFAGQGSQYVNPGMTAVLALPPLRAAFDQANRHFEGVEPLSRVAFPPPSFDAEGRAAQEAALRATEYAQPAIGALSAGQFRYLSELGFAAEGFLGHSFGELTSLWAAGSLDDEAYFALARARGKAMAPPADAAPGFDAGAMAAVPAPEERVKELLVNRSGLAVCNRNAPDQIVVGGATSEVTKLVAEADEAGLKASLLPVSAAFHTPFVEHALASFRTHVEAAEVREPRGQVFANTRGVVYGDDIAANRKALAEQLIHPVDFATRVEEMYATGFRVFVEFGPKGLLTGLVRRTLGDREHVALSLDGGPGKDADVALKQGVAQLAVLGLELSTADRYVAPVPAEVPTKGMTVLLNGINYVSSERRAAYRDALENGYQVVLPTAPAPEPALVAEPVAVAAPKAAPAPAPALVPVPAAAPAPVPIPVPAATVRETAHVDRAATAATDRLAELMGDHLALHDDYLTGQLRSAERLAALLECAAAQGRTTEVLPGVNAVKEHGLAIGRTHLRANEILRDLAGLENGMAPVRGSGAAARTAAPMSPAPPEPMTVAPAALRPAPTTAPAAPVPTVAVPAPAPADAVDTGPDKAFIEAALLETVAEKTGYPADMLELSMDVEADLGIDSIKRVEIMGVLQERFSAEVTAGPEQLAELRTLGDIVTFVAGQEPSTALAAPAAPAASGLDKASIEAALLETVAEKTGYPADMLELSMDVEADLGIDSIKRVEIMGVLQERFSAEVTAGPEQLAELRTLGDIATFVSGQAPGTNTPAAPDGPAGTATPEAAAGTGPGRIGRGQAALLTLPTPDKLVDAYPKGAVALVVDDGSELVAALNEQLVEAGLRVHTLRLPGVPERGKEARGAKQHALRDWRVTELVARVEEILGDGDGKGVSLVVDVAVEATGSWADGVRRLAHSLLVAKHMIEPLAKAAADGRAGFVTVTRLDGAFGSTGVDEELVPASGVTGLVKTMAIEEPGVFCRALDLAPALDADSAARLVLAEAYDAAAEPTQVGLDGTRRVGLGLGDTPSYASGVADAPDLGTGDLLVVTGGARGITAACVAELARTHRPGLLLLGRTPLEDEPAWARGVEETGLKAAAAVALKAEGEKPTPKRVEQLFRAVAGAREIRQTLERVRECGSEAEYLTVDITDPIATTAALTPYRERITGLVHGAGVLADQLIASKKASEVERVFAPKLVGLRSVMAAVDADKLRHIVLFSSVAGFFGNRGQSDYAMANEALNAWAASWKQRHPKARVTSLNWGAWDSGMVSPEIKAVFEERGITLIPVDEGASLFAEQFTAERAGDVVTVLGPTTPLPGREPESRAAAVTVERSLSGLVTTPIVADHVIGDAPVLPAAVALGWAIGAVERANGCEVREVRDFSVHKGIVFDGSQPETLRLEMTPAGDTTEVVVRSVTKDGAVRPHYAAVTSTETHAAATVSGLPRLGGGRDAAGLYADGTLFHGPALRGVRRVLAEDEKRLVLECALSELRPEGGAFAGARFAPGTADLLLQAGLVWVRLFRGTAGLPLAVAKAELHAALPDGEPFLVVVEPGEKNAASGGTGHQLTVTACGADGRVLTRLHGLCVVPAPQLEAKFRQ